VFGYLKYLAFVASYQTSLMCCLGPDQAVSQVEHLAGLGISHYLPLSKTAMETVMVAWLVRAFA